jgi:pimeloyl-ACP methyl ester carboxylesterase
LDLTNISSEIIEINSFDGYILKGKLTLPASDKKISKLVLYLNGSGPKTYHIDFFPEYYASHDIAFFSFNTRGVYEKDDFSVNKEINYEEYKTYLPTNVVEDIFYIIKRLKCSERLKDCNILLNGWSEGAMIAPLFAKKYPEMVNALLLCGYPNDNMEDVLKWQFNVGGWSGHEELFNAIERKDEEWIKIKSPNTLEWFFDHYKLPGNRTILPMLNLPIYIFHGTSDTQCDVNGVYEIMNTFLNLGKTNLKIYIFEKHDHCLNTDEGTSEGIKKLLEIIENY